MINKPINLTQKSFLLFLYIIILGIFGPALYWLSNSGSRIPLVQTTAKNPIQRRISIGDKILITAHNSSAKQAGVDAFAKGDYVTASEQFDLALKSDRNDPEARIYLNNTITAKTESSYRIGVSVPIGGNLAVAEEILRGVAQAQTKINSNGGINGKLLMVKIANDDNDPEIAQKVAYKFAEDGKILAVVGHNSSDVSIAAAPIYQEEGLVAIAPTSSAESLAKMGDYIFRTVPSTRALAEALADYAVNVEGKSNIAICIDSGAKASVSFRENFTWAVYNYGGKISPIECDLSAGDFVAENIPSQAISQGVDALLLAPSVRKVDEAMEIVEANKDRLTLLGNHTLNTYATLEQGQNAVNGMVLAVGWHPPSASKFTQDARQLWGGSVNWRTAMAYDATQTIAQAMTVGTTRETLQQALANPEFVAGGATTEVSFLPSGDRNLQGTLVEIKPGKKSGTGYDFVPLTVEPNSIKSAPEFATTSPQ